MAYSKIFFWHPSIDYHQYYTWLAFRSMAQLRVTFVLGSFETKIRKTQGWKQVDLSELHPIMISPRHLWRDGVKLIRKNTDAIHVFQSFRGREGYNYFPLILFALRKGIKVVIFDEAYSTSPVGIFHDENIVLAYFKTSLKPILRFFIALAINAASKPQKPCLMPLSLIAKKQFMKSGFDPDMLFPFGYFVPRQVNSSNNDNSSSALRLIFVGALIFRKGLDILVDAIRELHEQGYKIILDIYGSGNGKRVCFPDLPITYNGVLPFDQVQAVIAKYDLLILPSRHDGWGVVVNEALLQGVPVILSSRVGAKCLVESTGAGAVFESEDSSDLAKKIKTLIDTPSLLQELKENALKVGKEILPENAAQYFRDAISYYFYQTELRPSAIWSRELAQNH